MPDASFEDRQHRSPERASRPESGVDHSSDSAAYISRRPEWATTTRIESEAITHSFTAPTVASTIEPDGRAVRAPVEMYREDSLLAYPAGIALDVGPERVMVLDEVLDLENARLLAQAILQCCNRHEELMYAEMPHEGGQQLTDEDLGLA
jgi:hypothetical protein